MIASTAYMLEKKEGIYPKTNAGGLTMVRVYPADKLGRCLRGFCPTICASNEAERIALDLMADMHKYGFKYDHIVIEED